MFDKLFGRKVENSDAETAIDPICGMKVKTDTALRSERDGQIYYFCSPHCQRTFESQEPVT